MTMEQGARRGRAGTWIGALLLGAVGAALVLWWWTPAPQAPDTRNWTTEWRSNPPVVSTLPGGLLETATLTMAEDFYRSDSRTWWGIYLGNTISHIQAQATYRYGVPLADPQWRVVSRGPVTVVLAPVPAPSLPVAIDTATLRERTENGWARFDADQQLEELRRGMSSELADRAQDTRRLALARDASRRTIAEFVERWLADRTDDTPDVFRSVEVYFTDEADASLLAALRAGGEEE
ncbi:MAG: hypothetical protein AB7O67_18110 [Vicinamibacterales bacterium]